MAIAQTVVPTHEQTTFYKTVRFSIFKSVHLDKTTLKEYLLQSSLLGRKRKLVLTPDFVEFENGGFDGSTRLNKADIIDIRHGMARIEWYEMAVGRKFLIAFKTRANKVVKVEFKNFFELQKNYLKIYSQIVDDLWEYYLKDIVDSYLIRFYERMEDFELESIRFTQNGIMFTESGTVINWREIGIQTYYRYFAIFNTENPKVNKRFNFDEWNTEVLLSLVKTIKQERDDSLTR